MLTRASQLTSDELVALGVATKTAMGGWVWPTVPKRRWFDALQAANEAADSAGRASNLGEVQGAVMNSIFASAMSVAASRGKDPTALASTFTAWKQEQDEGLSRNRNSRTFGRFQRQLGRAVGIRVRQRLGPAVWGAAAAATAIET
jgi:hypothetical protein